MKKPNGAQLHEHVAKAFKLMPNDITFIAYSGLADLQPQCTFANSNNLDQSIARLTNHVFSLLDIPRFSRQKDL